MNESKSLDVQISFLMGKLQLIQTYIPINFRYVPCMVQTLAKVKYCNPDMNHWIIAQSRMQPDINTEKCVRDGCV